ncbi:hypothetical protein C5167_048414 [Papaver somniferum]|uniref:Neprosin PEP catalytic domain-containing protein n=1 Tax=Papaver somniferum TaxID=3469 RepID=A0A4Y7KL85_PAPSO|nr:uncharacterized protein LOC113303946 [Papaver somniferum]RZC72931.1 hypothetical protein C5167_048414 [Papaver somniferum]
MILINEASVEGRTISYAVNKAIIKTIKVENDEIIDCYDIYRQPSLNHPLLHNHTIQMRPSSYPKMMKYNSFGSLQLTQFWHKYGLCPKGTIPIRRKGKNYNPTLLRKHHYPTLSTSQQDNEGNHEYATIKVHGNFLGARAKINLWKPLTETPTEISVSQIWVSAGDEKNVNTIEAGWEVGQSIFGDDQTRFFLYWTTDDYVSTGCYNLLCEGFVHTSSNVALGCNFTELSTFQGNQKDATFSIYKDQNSGNWWIQLQGIPIGYYPGSLFTELSNTATEITWGGEITDEKSKGRHTSTQMGSGHFPSEGRLNISSYFNWVQVVDENNAIKDPQNVVKSVTNPNCYNLEIDDNHHNTNGYSFYYGGRGYNDKCQ